MNRMSFSGAHIMSFSLIVIASGVAISSLKWPFKTALFPLAIALIVLPYDRGRVIDELIFKGKKFFKGGPIDFKLSEDVDKKVALRRTLWAFSWIFGFFVLIVFSAFPLQFLSMSFFI